MGQRGALQPHRDSPRHHGQGDGVSSLDQYEGWSIEEIVARNSHELTAMHVLGARKYIVEQRSAHADEMRRLRDALTNAQRIGLEVLRAERSGRKAIRVSDLTTVESM